MTLIGLADKHRHCSAILHCFASAIARKGRVSRRTRGAVQGRYPRAGQLMARATLAVMLSGILLSDASVYSADRKQKIGRRSCGWSSRRSSRRCAQQRETVRLRCVANSHPKSSFRKYSEVCAATRYIVPSKDLGRYLPSSSPPATA